MTLAALTAKIYDAAENKAHLELLLYLRDERLGILRGVLTPTEDDVDIVNAQLFPKSEMVDSLK